MPFIKVPIYNHVESDPVRFALVNTDHIEAAFEAEHTRRVDIDFTSGGDLEAGLALDELREMIEAESRDTLVLQSDHHLTREQIAVVRETCEARGFRVLILPPGLRAVPEPTDESNADV